MSLTVKYSISSATGIKSKEGQMTNVRAPEALTGMFVGGVEKQTFFIFIIIRMPVASIMETHKNG